MLAKLETAEAGLRIKMFTLDLWARCTTFAYVEVARLYLTEGLDLGAVEVWFGQATKPVLSLPPSSLWIKMHPSSKYPLELPSQGTMSNKSVKRLQVGD